MTLSLVVGHQGLVDDIGELRLKGHVLRKLCESSYLGLIALGIFFRLKKGCLLVVGLVVLFRFLVIIILGNINNSYL